VPSISQAEEPPTTTAGRLLRGINGIFRKNADEGDN
jgi:hypothetical protein